MKKIVLMVALLAISGRGWAECQIFASQQKVSWGNLSPAERQQVKGPLLSLPEKQFQVRVVCSEPQRIRLFPGSDRVQNGTFALGADGEMQIVASHALVDDKPVRLAPVNLADVLPHSSDSENLAILPHQGLAFMDGSETYGKTATVTFTVRSAIKPGAIVERTIWRGNLKIKMDVR
ncbi:hypothetical protein [Leclercia barmai]|uniref:Uncharacterized protein n=1 Tax=Leclercia barmai TaxID=2785629 RepID=A0ABS7RUU8_9ENTR|nr:hypothetical protein [Leclercia sp. EMC7]MBZ0058092.1 hypothetical protein [Leclercia sp. EMC7]